MNRYTRYVLVLILAAVPALAQTNSDLAQAQQVLALADSAGAQQYAKSLYDDAAYRVRFAQENGASTKSVVREQGRMRAREALFAARAALAKARWAGTNAAIRNLQGDIVRFGGRSDLALQDENSNIDFGRGQTSKDRIDAAQTAIDQATAAGAEKSVADNDLKIARDTLSSANKVSRNGRDNSDVADHLAYIAEMIARRAYYVARFNESARFLPDVQLQRTRLAQTASEMSASAERAQRQEAERRAADLQRQLLAQESNRQAQAVELERLRQQVDEGRREMQRRVEADRAARVEATARLDEAMARYEAAAASAEADTLRRQVEDAEISLNAVLLRERSNEEAMAAEINALRGELQAAQNLDPGVRSQREADLIRRQNELERFREERGMYTTRRAEIDQRHDSAIRSLQEQRQQAELQAQQMRQQIEAAQQAAQQAAQAALSAQQQAESTKQQLQTVQQQAESTQQQLQTVQQQAQQQAAEAEKARQEARAAQEELERTRVEMARRDVEARKLAMEAELARLASTRRTERGFIVTLPGIFFDSGKTQLKAGARNTLTKIAAQLRGSDNVRIAVEGHTDSVGAEEKNMELSEKRAASVRDFLVSAGVPEDRITASGKGEAEPIATNKTTAGKQQNRRVELIITQ